MDSIENGELLPLPEPPVGHADRLVGLGVVVGAQDAVVVVGQVPERDQGVDTRVCLLSAGDQVLSRHHGRYSPPVLIVGQVVLQQGVGKETVKVGILTSYKLVLLQSILQSWGTFQLFKLLQGIVEDGGVGMGEGVDVRFPDGGWGVSLYQEVDCE